MRSEIDPVSLVQLLADGRFHSGQSLAQSLGISRAAVWKRIRRLQDRFDLEIDAVRGRGYRLRSGVELLDAKSILAGISPRALSAVESVECVLSTGSTNSLASSCLPCRSDMARVWFAEHQSAARGRRGREWVCSFADNLYFSLAWRFERPMAELGALSLVAGVAVCEALALSGVEGHGLKWPNDVVHEGRKLAGILLEVSGESMGPATAVIGIGVNVSLPRRLTGRIDQPWTDLSSISSIAVSRNQLATRLIDSLVIACADFARHGLPIFMPRWRQFDTLVGRNIQVRSSNRTVYGRYAGISGQGALLMENPEGRSEHLAGEVSVRRVEDQ